MTSPVQTVVDAAGRIPLDIQHVIDNIHKKYLGIISMMTQENAALQATVDNADSIIAEQDAELAATRAILEGMGVKLDD